MRPLRLELEGFGPYRERQAVDFSDVELFAITGPTGSGKSTLLDAIAFALYGQVPRVGRQVGTLKHPAAAKAWVSLTFRVGERVYRVERSRSEKRGDARVSLLEGGERLLDLPTLEAVNRALADLVGLDYEAFTRALLLPQGEFDRFLKGEPKERRQLLLELFELSRLERARQKAAERRGLLLEEKGRLEGELNGLSAATPEALEELERALDCGPGDEVIVPTNTYIATWLAVTQVGATPVPVEPDPSTYNLDPAQVEAAISPRTKVILAVNLYGQPCDYDPLQALARKHGIKLAIDNAQAHGARYKGRRVGGIADVECHSFYPSKNLGAFGEAEQAAIKGAGRHAGNRGTQTESIFHEVGEAVIVEVATGGLAGDAIGGGPGGIG